MTTVNKAEYVYLVCHNCGDRDKLAKNKGSYWSEFTDGQGDSEWSRIEEFFLEHADCPQQSVELEYDNL